MSPPTGTDPAPRGVIPWFVRNRVAANLLLVGIFLGGLLTIRGVPQEMIPEVRSSALLVRTVVPGASAEVIEEAVLTALEEAVRDVSGIEETTAVATDGLGLFTVAVESWADFRSVSDDVRERVESLTTLPGDAEDPVISEIAVDRLLLRIAVHGAADERSLTEAARRARDELAQVAGVSAVEVASGRDYEVAIEVSSDALTRFGLTFDQVAAAVRRQSMDIPGGSVRTPTAEVRLRADAEASNAREFERIPLIAAPGGGAVTLGDVGVVTDGFADVRRSARMNGEPAIFLEVLQAPGARLLETAEAVHAEVRRISAALPEAISATPWYDAWELYESRMSVLVRNGLQGLALIFLVLFLALSSRVAVWTAAGLPVAFFGAFLLMPGLGVTLNMISLFGFILTLGIVVDDAIVVGENIERRMAGAADRVGAAVLGARQVLFPAAFGVLTTMAAFLPLLGLPGVWGELMGNLPRIVLPVLAFSLLDAAWILPHHLVHGGIRIRPSRILARIRGGVQRALEATIRRAYRPALGWALRNRLATIALGIFWVALAAGLVRGGWVPVEMTPPFDSDIVTVQVSLPAGSPFEATRDVVRELEAAAEDIREDIRRDQGVDPMRYIATLSGQQLSHGPGGPVGGSAAMASTAAGQLLVALVPAEEQSGFSARSVADRLRERARDLPHGAEVTIVNSILGQEADVSLRLRGDRMDQLREAADALQATLAGFQGVTAVWDDLEGLAPELVARVRPGGAGTGIGAVDFGRQLRQTVYGEEVQRIQRGRDEVRVMLRAPAGERSSSEAIRDMLVRRPDGGVAPLEEVASVSPESGLAVVRRVDGRRAVTVHAAVNPELASSGALLSRLQAGTFEDLEARFPGVRVEVAGLAGDQADTLAALGQHLILAVILIYALLAIPLSSWTQPFVILAAVPFGMAGAVLGHLLLGVKLSMPSFFGIVPLTGIVVNDALVLLHFINANRRGGMPAREAILAAGPLRFRPVLLTTVTTCAGLAPLLAERSAQAQFLIPMAASLAFGVAFATMITLFLVPVLTSLLHEARDGRRSVSGALASSGVPGSARAAPRPDAG